MGCGISSQKSSEEEIRRKREIDRMLADTKKQMKDVFKMLLLGPSDSGKSTIVKQMRLLHSDGFYQYEIESQQSLIAGNILNSISAIIKAMEEFDINFQSADRQADAEYVRSLEKTWAHENMLSAGDWACLQRLWKDGGVQACFDRVNEFQAADSTKYFCDQIDRYSSPDFIPNDQDMLRSRTATLGIVEIEFTIKNLTCIVIDVGGQRSQRRKWIHCFENVNALIFVAAMSEYNQVLMEDNRMNRMHESLKLFNVIINCQWFRKTSVFLFLNKKDLFEEKLKRFPLSATFPEYKGNDYNTGVEFVKELFKQQNAVGYEKMIYIHITCATDTTNIEFVLDSCFDVII